MVLSSFVVIVVELGPLISAESGYRFNKIFGIKYTLSAQTVQSGQPPEAGGEQTQEDAGGFGSIVASEKIIQPVSTDYGLVIEKINANAKVIEGVDPGNEAEYVKALSMGVAEAKGSTKPGENGNLYIFSHSADAPWNIVRFNAVFYLLREMEFGDKVIVFYQGRRYDYVVFDKNVIGAKDISFLQNRYDKPVLTLQTCDPPGTIFNRLVVRARLEGS